MLGSIGSRTSNRLVPTALDVVECSNVLAFGARVLKNGLYGTTGFGFCYSSFFVSSTQGKGRRSSHISKAVAGHQVLGASNQISRSVRACSFDSRVATLDSLKSCDRNTLPRPAGGSKK